MPMPIRPRLSIAGLALLGLGLTAPVAAQNQDLPGDVEAGIDLAVEVCSQCHGVGFEEESPTYEAPTFYEIAQDPGVTALSLKVFFRTPHANMPDLHLTPAESDDVIAYILSIRE
jgi:mono/diheme cytochrome c family protein